jgi:hypothetical protein
MTIMQAAAAAMCNAWMPMIMKINLHVVDCDLSLVVGGVPVGVHNLQTHLPVAHLLQTRVEKVPA